MAHYAKVEDGIVTNVIVAEQDFIDYLKSENPNQIWIQTSYNTRGGIHYDPNTGQPSSDQSKALRKNYAALGYSYDATRDCFIPAKPFPSHVLDEATCLWKPPIPMPQVEGKYYNWDEPTLSWVEFAPII